MGHGHIHVCGPAEIGEHHIERHNCMIVHQQVLFHIEAADYFCALLEYHMQFLRYYCANAVPVRRNFNPIAVFIIITSPVIPISVVRSFFAFAPYFDFALNAVLVFETNDDAVVGRFAQVVPALIDIIGLIDEVILWESPHIIDTHGHVVAVRHINRVLKDTCDRHYAGWRRCVAVVIENMVVLVLKISAEQFPVVVSVFRVQPFCQFGQIFLVFGLEHVQQLLADSHQFLFGILGTEDIAVFALSAAIRQREGNTVD